jgi:hypothetical protein
MYPDMIKKTANLKLKLILVLFGIIILPPLKSQNITIQYLASDSFIANPERGWFVFPELKPDVSTNKNAWVNDATLKKYFKEGYRLAKHVTLIPTNISSIPQWYLDSLNNEAKRFRLNGMKLIMRFTYTWNLDINENDASQRVTEEHLEQLRPYFESNSDVIYGVEMGFIGYWGEMHNSTSGHILPETVGLSASGKAIVNKVLEVLPPERFLTLRYPQVLFRNPTDYGSFGYKIPVSETTAYNGSNQSRLGSWYANFGAGDLHYTENDEFMKMWSAQTNYLPMWSHCDHFEDVDMISEKWLKDAETFHYCALSNPKDESTTYDIYEKWKKDGVYDDFSNKLGYRFRLINMTVPIEAKTGDTLFLNIKMANDGFARPTNPRKIEFVFRNILDSSEYKIQFVPEVDERLWLPGPGSEKTLQVKLALHNIIPEGKYLLLLNLADPKVSLYNNPAYSIRLANQNLWEGETGYNNLSDTLIIKYK